jgi:hypothetical protein
MRAVEIVILTFAAAILCGSPAAAQPRPEESPAKQTTRTPFKGMDLTACADEEGLNALWRALLSAQQLGLIETVAYEVRESDREGLCSIIVDQTMPPSTPHRCPPAMIELVRQQNPKLAVDRIHLGQQLLLPNLKVEREEGIVEINSRASSDRARVLEKLCVRPSDRSARSAAGERTPTADFARWTTRISADDVEQLQQLNKELFDTPRVRAEPRGFPELYQYRSYAAPAAPPMMVAPADFRTRLESGGKCPENQEANLRRLLGSGDEICGACAQANKKNCPSIVILDPDGAPAHRDFEPAWNGDDTCRFVPTNQIDGEERPYHSLGLKGIIGSRANSRGLIGIFPMAEKIDVTPLREADDPPTSQEIRDRIGKPGRWVYVVATGWPDNPAFHSALSEAILATQRDSLWVVAAGQEEEGEGPEIDENYTESPMNLGLHPNVLVVTSCEDCAPGAPTLYRKARRSGDMVHVAAPGRGVLTTYLDDCYAEMNGTSPAAALAGGLAAAIWSCDASDSLKVAEDVKARMQITSRPVVLPAPQEKWVSAGIIDPAVARLDAGEVWLRRAGRDDYEAVSVDSWCAERGGAAIRLLRLNGNPFGDSPDMPIDTIRRIVRASEDSDEDGWFFYRAKRDDLGNIVPSWIKRLGPGTFGPVQATGDNAGKALPLLRLADGSVLRLRDIADLIGNPAIATKKQPCGPAGGDGGV